MSSTTTSPASANRGGNRNRSSQQRRPQGTPTSQRQNGGHRAPRPADGASRTETLRGTVSLNPRGFGFVTAVDPERPDVFIPPPLLMAAACIDADLVDVEYSVAGDKTTAQSINLVKRSRTRVVGIVVDGYLQPDPFVAKAPIHIIAPCPAQRVAALVELLPAGNARILEEFGHPASPAAVYARALERSRVAESAAKFPHPEISPELKSAATRVDLTDLLTFTIDGPESRDLDDALSIEPLANGDQRLYVHIADVACAVPEGSPMDQRARELATSVYLPSFSIPMIDPALSYGTCSLLEDQVRNALTITMDVDRTGKIVDTEIFESVIRSDARLTYEQVATFLDGTVTAVTPNVAEALTSVHDVTSRLGVVRARRGGLGSAESERQSDIAVVNGQIATVAPDGAQVAHDLIEEAMVAANESVAQWLTARGLPGVFRTHAGPAEAASSALTAFARTFGIEVTLPDVLTPRDLSDLENLFVDSGHADVEVFNVLADHLARATYTPVVGEHFGLASDGYVHFTSPIRRYADLTVHRIIKYHLAGATYDAAQLLTLCEEINAGAGRAARAESVARSLFFAILVQRNKRDTIYPAKVSRVSRRGVFVRLQDMGASGWISARDISESSVRVDDDAITLTAGRDVFTVGQAINVRVHRTDLEAGSIEFIQASKPLAGRQSSQRGARPQQHQRRR
jgi:ribonuclease R